MSDATTTEDLRLPELTQAYLDAHTARRAVRRPRRLHALLDVVAKLAPTQMIPDQRLTLDDARDLIASRKSVASRSAIATPGPSGGQR